ncbi:hypothetical protein GDO81_001076 [Engystomops pustulosus]|uniref:Uncharacterized protein n=1 Tax=Engystomops pustulosus TaxID=76066 RepID=A0AAV7D9K8_ENGPU|nr:hypothetical protein GDO81_001076 [Engystomops pustulosus]
MLDISCFSYFVSSHHFVFVFQILTSWHLVHENMKYRRQLHLKMTYFSYPSCLQSKAAHHSFKHMLIGTTPPHAVSLRHTRQCFN